MIEQQLKKTVVKIQLDNDGWGSGFLVQPETKEYSYVITARHCLLRTKNPISIEEKDRIKITTLNSDRLITVIEILEDERLDLAVIVVGFQEGIPEWKLKPIGGEGGFSFYYGFPFAMSSGGKIGCKVESIHDNQINTTVDVELSSFDNNPKENMSGISGSGLFQPYLDKLAIVGVALTVGKALNQINSIKIERINEVLRKYEKKIFTLDRQIEKDEDFLVQKICGQLRDQYTSEALEAIIERVVGKKQFPENENLESSFARLFTTDEYSLSVLEEFYKDLVEEIPPEKANHWKRDNYCLFNYFFLGWIESKAISCLRSYIHGDNNKFCFRISSEKADFTGTLYLRRVFIQNSKSYNVIDCNDENESFGDKSNPFVSTVQRWYRENMNQKKDMDIRQKINEEIENKTNKKIFVILKIFHNYFIDQNEHNSKHLIDKIKETQETYPLLRIFCFTGSESYEILKEIDLIQPDIDNEKEQKAYELYEGIKKTLEIQKES